MSEIKCPKCGRVCEGEAPNKPWFLQCECECGYEFCYDDYRSIYYDMEGNELKGEVMKYTKGKWKFHDTEDNVIVGEDHLAIADVNTISRNKEENTANAHRICQCVNNFDGLLEACKAFIQYYNGAKLVIDGRNAASLARQAIARAEEGR